MRMPQLNRSLDACVIVKEAGTRKAIIALFDAYFSRG